MMRGAGDRGGRAAAVMPGRDVPCQRCWASSDCGAFVLSDPSIVLFGSRGGGGISGSGVHGVAQRTRNLPYVGQTHRRRCRVTTMVISRDPTRPPAAAGDEEPFVVASTEKRKRGEFKERVRAWFAMARAAERDGDLEGAEELLQNCVALDERDGHSWLALARIQSRRDVALARRTFLRALEHCPNNVHLLQALGVMEHRCGRLQAARESFRSALRLDPKNPYVCQAWGLLEQRNGETEAARQIYRSCVELQPQSEVCAAWATLEVGDGNAQRARELFQLGLRYLRGPPNRRVAYLTTWAEAEERLGDVSHARELLDRALTDLPSPETRMQLAKLEARAGSFSKALDLMRHVNAAREQQRLAAEVYNGWAVLEMQAGNSTRARELLREGHEKYPVDAAILQTWGTLEERGGSYDLARELYGKSIAVRPTAVALVAWACMEARLGDVKVARDLFRRCLEVEPLHGAAYNAFATLEMKLGNISEARRIFELGLEFDPSASVLVGYAQLEVKFGCHTDRARELFRRGVSQTRGDTSFIWHAWVSMELREKNPLKARSIAAEARKRYARNSRLLVASALAEAAAGRGVPANVEQSRAFFKEAVLVDPSHAHAWQAWGVHELREGNAPRARSLFRKGAERCPRHGPLWQAWGVLEVVDGSFEAAEELFRTGIKWCPNHVQLHQAWACMEVRRSRFDVARELLEQALRSDPSHGPLWTAYGLLESKHGTLERARELFVNGLRHDPNHGPLYRTYATVEERAANHERARELFWMGLTRDPFDAPSYRALSLLEKKLGSRTAFKELALQARDHFGAANVKSVLLEGRCNGWASGELGQMDLDELWSMEHALDVSHDVNPPQE